MHEGVFPSDLVSSDEQNFEKKYFKFLLIALT